MTEDEKSDIVQSLERHAEAPTDRSQQDTPQLNEVRRQYADGELSDAAFERLVEAALEDGPEIGIDRATSRKLSGLGRLSSWVAGIPTAALMKLFDYKADDATAAYSFSDHRVRIRTEDADTDSHPAESAGGIQVAVKMIAPLLWLLPFAAIPAPASPDPSVLLTWLIVLLAVPPALAVLAPKPIVDMNIVGLGRHVAGGGRDD